MPTIITRGAASAKGFGFSAADGQAVFNVVISASTKNVNFRSKIIAAGWNGTSPVTATITVNNGVIVGSTSTSSPSFTLDGSWPTGSNLFLVNNGKILAKGGSGGAGANTPYQSASPGAGGGTAISVNTAISITNNGTIAGGGGGGGGGGQAYDSAGAFAGGGGGGGAGYSGGAGGFHGTGTSISPYWTQYLYAANGSAGTSTAGGAGGAGDAAYYLSHDSSSGNYYLYRAANAGGAGGGLGAAGNAGSVSGGPTGYYLTGNSNVTWLANGTRLGNVS